MDAQLANELAYLAIIMSGVSVLTTLALTYREFFWDKRQKPSFSLKGEKLVVLNQNSYPIYIHKLGTHSLDFTVEPASSHTVEGITEPATTLYYFDPFKGQNQEVKAPIGEP